MKIGVIGLGLIGGSILKSLHGKGYELCAVSKSSWREAQHLAVAGENIELVRDCDLIFVSSPMSKTLETLDSLEGLVHKDTIVCDVASLKTFVMQKPRPYKFIGTHPMAGTELSGFEASFVSLFEGAKWAITEHNEMLENVIKNMGAAPVLCEAREHDYAAAMVSHLPMFISFGLCSSIENNKLAQILASSGFRDVTRVALTPSEFASDMLEMNSENIEKGLEILINKLNSLKNLPHGEKIKKLARISENRRNMYDGNGKNRVSRCDGRTTCDEQGGSPKHYDGDVTTEH